MTGTINDLERELLKRKLALHVLTQPDQEDCVWAVHVYQVDAPDLGAFTGTGDCLASAIVAAIQLWDKS